MIVGVCGFSWTGSSAVIDYLSEFDELQIYNQIEFIIAFAPDGLLDLDYNLNEKYAKFLSSSVAIPRFKKAMNYLLQKPTNGKIDIITNKYIDSLVGASWIGCGQGDYALHNSFIYKLLFRVCRKIRQTIPYTLSKTLKVYPLRKMEISIRPDDFMPITQKYVENVFIALGLNPEKTIVLDQPFPGNNPIPSMKYYKDSYAIVVDRDPRDLFLISKKYFPKRSWSVPGDVNAFINYYKDLHKNIDAIIKDDRVLYLKFEELVYEFEKTANTIRNFLNLPNIKSNFTRFNPNESIVNTQLFNRCADYSDEINIIKKELNEYLFDFSKYGTFKQEGQVFDEKPPIVIKNEKK